MIFVVTAAVIWANYDSWLTRPSFSGKEKAKHLVIISVDALNAGDLEKMQSLPGFKKLLDRGAYAREVVGVYPSLTYVAHTTIVTGVYPDRHGVTNNEVFQPGHGEMDWYWFKEYIKVPTLYDIARKSGMKSGALLWPVTGRADIDFNMPEIKAPKGQSQLWAVLSNGSPLFLLECQLKYGKLRSGISQPNLDDFVTASAINLIRSEKPNLLLIHLTDLDDHRHRYGTKSGEAYKALERQDRRLGEIVQAAVDAGIYEDCVFVVLGDHGFLDVKHKISLNSVFKKEGLIDTAPDGKLADWKAFQHSCDGSAYIYIKNKNDLETRQKVESIMASLLNDSSSGIEALYGREEMARLRAGGDADYMVEAREGYCFVNGWEGAAVSGVITGEAPLGEEKKVATHGYLPDKKGGSTIFVISGPGVKKGAVLQRINMIDEAPTMAALLGLEMPLAEGKILADMLDQ